MWWPKPEICSQTHAVGKHLTRCDRSSCLFLEQASRCLQVPLMGMVRWIQLQIKRALGAWNGYGVNKQVLRFWAQHVNVFSVECRICHVRFTATLWSTLTLIYWAWIEDLCVVLLARVSRGSQPHSSKADRYISFLFFFSYIGEWLCWLHGQICQSRLGIR